MSRNRIGSGLHYITRAEISESAKTKHQRDTYGELDGRAPGAWPDGMTNASLRRALCNGCNYPSCVCSGHCRYGQEAHRRIMAGTMKNCLRYDISQGVGA